MTGWRLLALLAMGVWAAWGCRGEKAPAGQAGRLEPRASATPAPGAPASLPATAEDRYALTKEKLESYVRYQKSLIGLYEGLLKDLEKLPSSALKPDAGRASLASTNTAMRILESKAKAEELARSKAGLSERDAREIERMVVAVVNKRDMGRQFDPTTAIKQWEAMREKVPPEQRVEIDKSITDFKQQQAAVTTLTDERQEFGDANVDLLLTREEELTASYRAYLARLSGHR